MSDTSTAPQGVDAVDAVAQTVAKVRDHLATLGAEPKPQTPEEFGRYINADSNADPDTGGDAHNGRQPGVEQGGERQHGLQQRHGNGGQGL